MSDVVLDASALLAMLQEEPGHDIVAACLPHALVSTVNFAEVVSKLADAGMPQDAIAEALALPLTVVPFSHPSAFRTGMLRATTRALGLSLGDRACLALAAERGCAVVTTDAAWKDVPDGPEVRLIRSPESRVATPATGKPPRRRR